MSLLFPYEHSQGTVANVTGNVLEFTSLRITSVEPIQILVADTPNFSWAPGLAIRLLLPQMGLDLDIALTD